MSEKYREVIVIEDSFPSSPELMATSLRHVLSLKNRDEIKKFEETEDCFVLEFDPDDELNFSEFSISYNAQDDDLSLVAEKGKVACGDYPHSRHACGKFPFEKTPHDSHCELCYCYVCDLPAPCKKWIICSHCDVFDNESWCTLRKFYRDRTELQKKVR